MSKNREEGRARVFIVLAVAACLSLIAAVAAMGTGGGTPLGAHSPGPGGAGEPTAHAAAASKCGLGNGKKATGTPIKVGAVVTKTAGTDFTDISNMAGDYFACVNANGGINGHPVKMYTETEAIDPGQAAAAAKKLVESDKVVALVANISIIECTVNHKYYESKGFKVIGDGIAPECYSTPNFAATNMGPRYSSDGAVQYAVSLHPSKIVFDQSNVPGTGYIAAGPNLIAKKAKLPIVQVTDNVPIQDGKSIALKLVQQAGKNGSIVLNFTPPEALKILQGAQSLNIQNNVKSWGCSTPCNTDFLAKALGPKWNNKLFVNAELALTSAKDPDSVLYRKVLQQYGKNVAGGLGSFSQMGFVDARIVTSALLHMKPPYTVKSVNAALEAVKNFKTGLLCKPWYYGPGKLHLPNNTDWTVTPNNGHMVYKGGCFGIDSVEPAVATARKIEASGKTR